MTYRPVTAEILRAALNAYLDQGGYFYFEDHSEEIVVDGWIDLEKLAAAITAEMDKVTE